MTTWPWEGKLLKLLDHAHMSNTPLFSDLGEDVFVPTPVGEFPPCHYLKVPDA